MITDPILIAMLHDPVFWAMEGIFVFLLVGLFALAACQLR